MTALLALPKGRDGQENEPRADFIPLERGLFSSCLKAGGTQRSADENIPFF
ncbi:hypothetical protein G3N95_18100 [Paraburkholderia sp. Tr-20389]|uniref:hypothetical protein n=1 Tax=Paraburkholderia sp. Tr-20389 TaxID=2703903 RepID=UPI00197E7D2A|nr:hypothetical protein [Paraburkholderia sp. Tr-20389]MBN3754864.1 hypothetical protein [Paraburkholderia sp. Tr-20389]